MAFQLKPFQEILKMTSQAVDEALAPIRARTARAKAELEVAKLDEERHSLEQQIHELCTKKDLDFDAIIKLMDKHELSARRAKQVKKLVDELFPSK